jgi:hypothetical protein
VWLFDKKDCAVGFCAGGILADTGRGFSALDRLTACGRRVYGPGPCCTVARFGREMARWIAGARGTKQIGFDVCTLLEKKGSVNRKENESC